MDRLKNLSYFSPLYSITSSAGRPDSRAKKSTPSVLVGSIARLNVPDRGGTKFNIVPDHGEAVVDLRLLPSQWRENEASEVFRVMREACPGLTVERIAGSQALDTDPSHPLVGNLVAVGGKPAGAAWFCYAAIFSSRGIPAVAVGPGSIAQAHTEDEFRDRCPCCGTRTIPVSRIWYQGLYIGKMDIDAIIARNPSIVLVDELAHTNAPNSRHLKRYQDIEELLRAGISVYTTVNIQHVESLNDAISQITGIQVKETVPDTFFDLAEDIRLIDLTPEELIARLKAGKVYFGDMATQAVDHFFSSGNLTALRQLTLRYLARLTDKQMVTHMRARAFPGPWPAVDRILVAIRPGPMAEAMVRAAYRDSQRMNAEWVVLSIQEEREGPPTEQERAWLRDAMDTARKLGGKVVVYRGEDVAKEILRYASQNNVTTIMLGKPRGLDILVSPVYRIMRKSHGIDIILFDAQISYQ